jgi:hypothetical protein
MIHYVCDFCSVVKQPSEVWILGLAAEQVGVTAARREVSILPTWDSARAVHPLAVHFCSVECKENYMSQLFTSDAAAEDVVVESEVPAGVAVQRSVLPKKVVVTTVKSRKPRRSRRAV